MRRRWLAWGAVILAGGALIAVARTICLPAWLLYGVRLPYCPDGEMRQTAAVNAYGLRRGQDVSIGVSAIAHYTRGKTDFVETAGVGRFSADLHMLDAAGKEIPLEVKQKWWEPSYGQRSISVRIPDVPDGDYTLRATVDSSIAKTTQDAKLPLYAPARIHVITDRPLYEPGNTVQFRAVVLRAKDLSPLDKRPGTWFLTDPSGDTLLEEKAPAGEWGVVQGSFPLDSEAQSGDWHVRWVSGGTSGESTFKVQPFTLPRFRVEVEPSAPYYLRGQRPKLRGTVTYSSGAPVANALVELEWSTAGEWPPPSDWMTTALPKHARTAASGHFDLELPVIPADLRDRVTLSARISAIDPAGDRVEGGTSLLLTEDPIQVTAVTELQDGLVEGFNNRVYLRLVSASGQVLSGAELRIRRAWEPGDKGIKATTDEDGVAAIQLDPGPAVNVVIPPMPYRPPPPKRVFSRGGTSDMLTQEDPPLADQVAMDGWISRLESCGAYAEEDGGSGTLTFGVRVNAAGAVVATGKDSTRLARCVAGKLAGEKLPAGKERLYQLEINYEDPDMPRMAIELRGAPAVLDALSDEINGAALGARGCLPRDTEGKSYPRVLTWQTRKDQKEVSIAWMPDASASGPFIAAAAATCVEQRFEKVLLPEPANMDAIGVGVITVSAPESVEASRPQAMTMLGYELTVDARKGGEDLGKTSLRMNPGSVPPVRMRATPILARAGDPVEVEILRGPGFTAELPEKLWMTRNTGSSIEGAVDKEARKVRFTLPADAEGWFETSWSGARALVYVKSKSDLAVELKPEKARYAPGDMARIGIHTAIGGAGARAAVGLIGVDESLAQLVALPGPDELAKLRPQVVTPSPAFGMLDGQALAMGRIRGANAAAATVLRVTQIPAAEDIDSYAGANESGSFDPLEPLTDNFYRVLAELHTQVRAWEEKAPEKEQMKPPTMAKLWSQAIEACDKRGEPTKDAFGRTLTLSRLPGDLLAMTDPRVVVVRGTRLPEDVEDWAGWVRRERP